MSNEDYRQGYKEGFQDGLEEGKKQAQGDWMDGYMEGLKKTMPPPYVPPIDTIPKIDPWQPFELKDKCPKCGMTLTSPMGYVCRSPNCPTFPNVTSGVGIPLTSGAVGARVDTTAWPRNDEYYDPANDLGGWDGKGPRNGWYGTNGEWIQDRSR